MLAIMFVSCSCHVCLCKKQYCNVFVSLPLCHPTNTTSPTGFDIDDTINRCKSYLNWKCHRKKPYQMHYVDLNDSGFTLVLYVLWKKKRHLLFISSGTKHNLQHHYSSCMLKEPCLFFFLTSGFFFNFEESSYISHNPCQMLQLKIILLRRYKWKRHVILTIITFTLQ